jgi:hypothetical protein
MAEIEGLPTRWIATDGRRLNLARVPPGPEGPHDPGWVAKRRDYERWYWEVRRYRSKIARICEHDRGAQATEREICAAAPAYFVNVWCQFYEERQGQTPFGAGWLPAIQQEYMVDLLAWLGARLAAPGGMDAVGAISKPRDITATTTICQWLLHGFLFLPVYSAKVISRKEELVDTAGDMDSVLERIASHLFADEDGWCPLPAWMRPEGIDDGFKLYRQHLKLARPGNRNRIRGESTSKRSARGGRSTVGFIDECSYIDRLELLLGAIMDSIQCLILASSESIETTEAFQEYTKKLREHNPRSVLELEYWLNLYHDDLWLAKKKAQAVSEAAFRREILRDAYAGFTDFIYQDFRQSRPAPGDFPYEAPMPLYVGIDPGFDDHTAIGWVAKDTERNRYRLVEARTWRLQEPEFYAHILAGTWLLPTGEHAEFVFADADYRLMQWSWGLPRPTVCGDPSGWARKHAAADSVYDRIQRRYKLITGRALDIRKHYGVNEQRTFQARWNALRALLRRLDFNDTAGCRHVMDAIAAMQLEADRSDGRLREQREPRHNWATHPTSMMEFLAQALELMELLAASTTVVDGERRASRERVGAALERLTPLSRASTLMERG